METFGLSQIKKVQNPNRNMHIEIGFWFLRTLLCSNEIFNPGYNRKTLIGKKTSILDGVCFTYEQLFHSIQCNACRKCHCNSKSKRAFREAFRIQSTLTSFQYP